MHYVCKAPSAAAVFSVHDLHSPTQAITPSLRISQKLVLLLLLDCILLTLHVKLAKNFTTVSFWFCSHLEQTAQLHM